MLGRNVAARTLAALSNNTWTGLLGGALSTVIAVGLATAMAGHARIMITAKPTPELDPANTDRIMALIRGLTKPDRGVLAISLDLPQLVRIADRILVLRNGEEVEEAWADTFVGSGARLTNSSTRALWSAHLSLQSEVSHVA